MSVSQSFLESQRHVKGIDLPQVMPKQQSRDMHGETVGTHVVSRKLELASSFTSLDLVRKGGETEHLPIPSGLLPIPTVTGETEFFSLHLAAYRYMSAWRVPLPSQSHPLPTELFRSI